MVGIRQPDSGANFTSPFVAADAVFRPREFTDVITDFGTVPYCTSDWDDNNNILTDHLSRAHTPANIARGVGDICRYMDTVDGVKWRMPAASEIAELYGSPNQDGADAKILGPKEWIEGNYYQLRGRAMGPNQNSVAINGNDTDARVTNADPYISGAVFLPASGYRNFTDGAIQWIGLCGLYWSSTASTANNGYFMQFTSSNVYPQDFNRRTHAFTIRCIRE